MRCVTIEELAIVSGGADPKACFDAVMAGSGAGATAAGFVGAIGGSVVPFLGTAGELVIVGAVGGLFGGAISAANSPTCAPTPDFSPVDDVDYWIDPWSGTSYSVGSGPWDYDPDWME
ncbi:hypothetical protein SKTS_25410 [Sulfurimicrobium lacus]|uniref:Bacteriocin n=1 Tax=Sulfurimicrobium lacus TaxID=2715678 RepID=A0A6F8VFW7_9PROT|nr:hypothetical protein SKTS_25410 [Sulfurimicrobium lacus]